MSRPQMQLYVLRLVRFLGFLTDGRDCEWVFPDHTRSPHSPTACILIPMVDLRWSNSKAFLLMPLFSLGADVDGNLEPQKPSECTFKGAFALKMGM